MLEAASADLVSPSASSAAPNFFSYPQAGRPMTPSFAAIRTGAWPRSLSTRLTRCGYSARRLGMSRARPEQPDRSAPDQPANDR